MVSVGVVRSISLLLIALLGILGQVAVPTVEGQVARIYDGELQVLEQDNAGQWDAQGDPLPEGYAGPEADRYAYQRYDGRAGSLLLPELGEASLVSEHWTPLYNGMREILIVVAILGVLVTAVLQYRDETASGALVIAPFAVLAYLALPVFLPDGQNGALGALLCLACLLAIALGTWADLQPDAYGRPPYYSALGVILAMVMYVGQLDTAVSVPGQVIGDDASMIQVRWGMELLAVIVAPAALVGLPALKLAWNRSPQGKVWWA